MCIRDRPREKLRTLRLGGGFPLLMLECADRASGNMADLLLRAHALFRMNGLKFDLALLCSPASSESPALTKALGELCRKCHSHELLGKDGGVHLRERKHLSEEQVRLLRAAARLVLHSNEGSIAVSYTHLAVYKRQGYVYVTQLFVR